MWFAQKLAPSVPIFIAQYVELHGPLDVGLLRQTTIAAAKEFESPLIKLLEVDGEPYQLIDLDTDSTIPLIDFREEPDPLAAAHEWMDTDYVTPIPLIDGPRLVEMTLLQVGSQDYLWYSRIHHVALDGYGAMTMLNRIAALYTAAVEGTDPGPATAADLHKLYELDEQYRTSTRFDNDRAYWRERLAGHEHGSTLSTHWARTAARSRLASAALSESAIRRLDKADEQMRGTAAAVLIAAFAAYLSRMTGRSDVLVNMPVSARTTMPLRRSGGMLVNIAPLCITVRPDDTVGELIGRVQLELMGALRHQRCSIEDIRRDFGGNGSGSLELFTGPMVNVMLFRQELRLGELVGEYHIVTSGPVDDLLINIYQSGNPVQTILGFRANPNRYDDTELHAHHAGFMELVEEFVAADPQTTMGAIHEPSAAEGARRLRRRERGEFWRAELGGVSPAATGEHESAPLSVAEQCRRFAADHEMPARSVIAAALTVVLARLADVGEVVLGVDAGDGAVPVRVTVDSTMSFADHAADVRDREEQALAHADATFDEILAAAGLPDDLTVEGLCRALIGRPDGEEHHGDGVTVTAAPGVAARLVRALAAAVADPTGAVGDLPLLGDDELAGLAPVDGPAAEPPRTLAQILTDAAAREPEATAVIDGDRVLTYADLDEWSNRLARLLIGRGAGPETVVAVAVPRSVASVLSVWAVAKSGAAFVPVDPHYPPERIEHMLTDSRALLVLAMSGEESHLPSDIPLLALDDSSLRAELEAQQAGPITDADRSAPDTIGNRAYLIYTSGSTGIPKGVTISHRGLANLAAEAVRHYRVSASSRTLHFSSPSFDASMLELMLAVGAGATMVIAPPTIFGGEELHELLRTAGVTHAFVTPAALASVGPEGLSALRTVITGGEACPPELVAQWGTGRELFNAYGPTETTVIGALSEALVPGESVTIGRPPTGCRVLVLDHRLHPVPRGVPGELYIAGDGLARGYHRRPGTSAERFVANPFADPGERMYRTGDVVRWNRAGELEYLGRVDDQVKVRGFRIELGEIDSTLTAHPDVRFAATVGRPGPSGVTVLVSYVQPVNGTPVSHAELLELASESLPSYMVPSAIVTLDRIPLTPAGKLDRKALPEPDFDARTGGFREPTTPTEEAIAEVFATVLGADRISIDDSFFDLGGNSLVATRVTARVNAALGTEIGVLDLFESPTVKTLAARADTLGPRASRPQLRRIEPRPDPLPLSLAGQRMWFLNQLDPGTGAYNIPVAIELRGTLDLAALRAALADVIERHETLRTVYPESEAGPHQVVLPAASVVPELRAVPSETAPSPDEFAARPFDVSTEVPLHVQLVRHAPDHHTLALVVHHIATDGYSMGPLARDVMVAYIARREERAPQWSPLAVQYADYTLWQREMLGTADDPGSLTARQLDYWRAALAGAPELLELPLDRPRPATQSGRGGVYRFTVPVELNRRLLRLAAEQGSSLFMVLHAALAVLLARCAGAEDIPIGTPVAGRGEAELDDLVGLFVNTLALRTDVDPDTSFLELIDQVRLRDLEAFGNADVPFEQVVEAVDPPRSRAHSPLFQVLLVLQNASEVNLALPGLDVDVREIDNGTTKFDMQLTVTERPDGTGRPTGLAAEFTYATDLFDESTIDALGGRFVRILRAVTDDPAIAVGDIDLLDPLDREQVLIDWNATAHPLPATTLTAELVEQAGRTPQRAAVVFGDAALDYATFDERVCRLGRSLIDRGVGPESRVAVAMRRSADLLVAIHAVIRAGGAYVPIDPDHPRERIAHILDTARPVCVLTTSADAKGLDSFADGAVEDVGVETVAVDTLDLGGVSGAPITDAERIAPVRPENTAYVIFTSGSTGVPKGVAVSHGAIVNRLTWMQHAYPLTADDVVLHKTPITFDVSVWELFWPLLVGASLVVAEPEGHRDPAYLARVIDEQRITTMHFVPSMLSAFLAGADRDRCAKLTRVFCSGEALPPSTVAEFHAFVAEGSGAEASGEGATLHNLYGPTEAAVDVTSWDCGPTDVARVPIGAPVWNTQVYVLDRRLRPVPVGSPGELYLAGVQLARGYVARPELSADRFVADPFGGAGARMYRTGDLVRWLPDGNLEYLGRTDFQVKLRGLRIELPEIEQVLLDHDDVARAVVVVHQGAALVGYVVAPAGRAIDIAAVLDHVRTQLPDYMVPAQLVVLDEFPLGPSGKLDRRALPDIQLAVHAGEYVAPRTPAEEVLAAIFADLLIESTPEESTRIGVYDSFFDLGGNSLVATRMVARAAAALGTPVAVRDLFDAPTVAGLAALVADRGDRDRTRPALTPRLRPALVPVSTAQRRMWFINQYDTSSAAYNVVLALRLTGALDRPALTAALTDVLARHESLRTVYPAVEGEPTQVIVAARELAPDLEPQPVDSPEQLQERIAAEASRGFDVAAQVPVRATLFAVGSDGSEDGGTSEHVLMVVVHHICADGFSLAPLARDLVTAYTARTAHTPPQWTPLPVQYVDYALWQHELLGAEDDPESTAYTQLDHWRAELAGLPDLLALPLDHPRPAQRSQRGARVDFAIDAELHRRIVDLARSHGASVFMTVHAALAVLLARLADTDDVAVGTPISGRGEAGLDELVGMFVNTLVLRTQVDAGAGFGELLAATRRVDLAAYAHADLPFERLVEVLNPARSTAYAPLFQVMLEFQDTARPSVDLPGIAVSAYDLESNIANFDLQVTLAEQFDDAGAPAGISGGLRYATDLFEAGSVRRFGDRFVRILASIAQHPDAPVGDIDLLGRREHRTLAPVTGTADTAPRTLVRILADAADRDPQSVALTYRGTDVTYAELDERSNALARVLIDRGAGPEVFVALALPRSLDSITWLWAVAKSGAAFLPVDPDYPDDRITHMLTDSGAALGVTDTEHRDRLPDVVPWLVTDDVVQGDPAMTVPLTDADRCGPIRLAGPAYLIYTSGSTGTPKGVVVTHAGLSALAEEERTRFGVDGGSSVLHFSSPSFDASVLELLLTFGAGARMVIAPNGLYGGTDLHALLADEHVTHAFITPAALASVDPAGLGDLRAIGTGGEACPPDLVSQWAPGRTMINAYGPTEATVATSMSDALVPGEPVTIGGPTRGCAEMVLDARLHPVPVGVAGDLYVAGAGLARGYHRRAGTTAERFVANPFGGPGERMYRTGDVVRWVRGQGGTMQLEYLGRSDFQVKVRGFRIELGEIEAALAAHPAIARSAVATHTDGQGVSRLVGYVTAASDQDRPEAADVLAFVGTRLAPYMVPAALVVLDELPTSPTGKLDRRALPEPDFGARAGTGRAPVGEVESVLAGLFAEVLGLPADTVGVDDSFFALGGDSIMSIQLVSRAKAAGLFLSPRDVFERKSVAGLAEIAVPLAAGESAVLEELPGGGVGEVALTPIVHWMLERAEATTPDGDYVDFGRHSQAALLSAPADLQMTTLTATVQAVLDRHDILRAQLFRDDDGSWRMMVPPAGAVSASDMVRRIDVDADSREPEFSPIVTRALDEAEDRLSPQQGQMLHVVWLVPAAGPGRLLVVAHHTVVDGVSWRVLVPDLASAFAQVSAGGSVELLPVGTSVRRWARGLVDSAGERSSELGLWRSVLDGPDPLIGSRPLDSAVDVAAS
ncbi:amino acid adenylation domain-containing protein, partial [Speluncibacter jeojiensis]|uniref:amino acid adenylation domain-containing protein n=1 Tax=Speluncibacter jeojiensis TaxID=2710754 RepID=UPI0038CD3D08